MYFVIKTDNPRANGRKPGARVTNSAVAFTYIRIMRCYIAQWHSGIKSRPIRHFLCHGRWLHRDYKRIEWASRKKCRISRGTN